MNVRPAKAARAFTLVEIMIALAIFATVIVAIYSSWTAILRSTRVAHTAAIEAQRARIAVRALEEALQSIQMFQENLAYYYLLADTSGDFASLSCVSRLPGSFPRNGNFDGQALRRVTFTVEPGPDSRNDLVLRQNPVLFEPEPNEEENPLRLARNVRQFSLEFWGPQSKEWEPEWPYTNQLPRFVRFSLAFGQPDQKRVEPDEIITRVIPVSSIIIPGGMQMAGSQAAPPPQSPPP